MEFSAGTVKKIDDYIIEIYFDKDGEIDQVMAIDILNKIITLSLGDPHALLYNFNDKNVLLSDIAKKLSGVRNYNNANLISRAMFSKNIVSNMESTHYIKNAHPQAETRLFNDREKALTWLNVKVKAFMQPD